MPAQVALGSSASDRAYDIASSINNEFFVAGTTTANGSTDILVLKLDRNGNTIWSKTFGGSENESVRKVSATSDGGLLVTMGRADFVNLQSGTLLGWKF